MGGVVPDITDIKRAQEALSKAVGDLQVVNGELESFSYSVSHDLRAPLRGMGGFSRILMEDYADRMPDDAKELGGRIDRAAARMGTLVAGLLRLSQLGRAELEPERLDLTAMATQLVRNLEDERPCDIHIQPGLSATGDRRLVGVVLQNLIENAWKFSAGAEPDQPFPSAAREKLRRARVFCVKDNGAGFDMAYADKLFGAFQRLHTEKEFAGTGIGLATAQRVIQRHGGKIWAESVLGQGSSFYFTLPTLGGEIGLTACFYWSRITPMMKC